MNQTIKDSIIAEIKSNYNYLANSIDNVLVEEDEIFCTFLINSEHKDDAHLEKESLNTKLQNKYPLYKIYINIVVKSPAFLQKTVNLQKTTLPNIKYIVAVASGKGGVGKSTITLNLAYALLEQGLAVGILDGDIYGPSIDFMIQGQKVEPLANQLPIYKKNGLIYNSVSNYLENKDDAIILKAPLVVKLFNQLINDSNWGKLDVLLIDLPPGTGDVHINLALKFNISGVIIVCTPQKLALLDATKSINMYKKTNTNIIGLIENMSSFQCPKCEEVTNIFDSSHTENKAIEEEIPFLGLIPLSVEIRECADNQENFIKKYKNNVISNIYKQIAEKTMSLIDNGKT